MRAALQDSLLHEGFSEVAADARMRVAAPRRRVRKFDGRESRGFVVAEAERGGPASARSLFDPVLACEDQHRCREPRNGVRGEARVAHHFSIFDLAFAFPLP